MEQKRRIHSGMIQRFDRTHVVLGHFVWQGLALMKFATVFSASPNPVLLASSARQHLHLRKDQVPVHLRFNVRRVQLTRNLHQKDFMQRTRAQSSPQLVYQDSTHQQYKQINVSHRHVKIYNPMFPFRLMKQNVSTIGYECPAGTTCSE